MLPGMDGFEVLKRIRAESSVNVLLLTARGEDVDRIVGLEIGADDYFPKPFNPRELLARMRAILRRNTSISPATAAVLRVGDLELDPAARQGLKSGVRVELTDVEFGLLEALMQVTGKGRQSRGAVAIGTWAQIRSIRSQPGHACEPAAQKASQSGAMRTR